MPFKSRLVTLACLLALGLSAAWSLRPAAAEDGEVDLTVFYTSLEPHGEWMHVQPFGWAWIPDDVDYGWRPYTVGHWTWVEPYGWMWVSDEPWAWATYHYGRWVYLEEYGWAWVPGTVWAPAWVAFRYADPWVGWAPMPPGPNWRPDAGFDAVALDVDVPAHAWTFVPLRHFAEPDLRSRAVVSTYNPFLVQRTRPSTRYVAVAGGFANLSIDVTVLERARGAPVPRRRLQVAPALPKGPGVRIAGDSVIVYRPRVTARPQAQEQGPAPRVRVRDGRGPDGGLDAWTARRQAALKAHLEAQRKALETPGFPPFDLRPGVAPEEEAKRREAAQKAFEEEQKRLERLFERQRKRFERPPPSPGRKDDGPGRGRDDKGEDDDDDKDDGRRKKKDDD